MKQRGWRICEIVLLAALIGCRGASPTPSTGHSASAEAALPYEVSAPVAIDVTAALSEDEMREDVEFLQRTLDTAYAPPHLPLYELADKRVRELAAKPATRLEFCRQLAATYKPSAIDFLTNGLTCRWWLATPFRAPSVAAPTSRNYGWRVDREGGSDVGVLTIKRFAAPDDPGWTGFDETLRQLGATEVVAIDVENAPGDDPRMGFAVLAALGLQDFTRKHLKPSLVRDNAIANVARRNLARRGTTASRSRTLWSQFDHADAIAKLGRTLAPATRSTELGNATFVQGAGCETACQMLVALASSQKHVEVVNNADLDDLLSGDERGLVRLPHSGIEVTFPTVAYWPNDGGSHGTRYVSGGWLTPGTLVRLHQLAKDRGGHRTWSATKPTCASLPRSSAAPRTAGWCGDRIDVSARVSIFLTLDEASSRSFLDSCGAALTIAVSNAAAGHTIAFVEAPTAALERIASAPFVRSIECEHKMELNSR